MTTITTLLDKKESQVAKLEEELNAQMQEFDKLATATKPKKTAIKAASVIIGGVLISLGSWIADNIMPILGFSILVLAFIYSLYMINECMKFSSEKRVKETTLQNEKLKMLYYDYDDAKGEYTHHSNNFILVPISNIVVEYRRQELDTLVAADQFPYNSWDCKDRNQAKIIVPTPEDELKWKIFLEKAKNGITVRRVPPPEEK